MKYRKIPHEVEAIQWNGENYEEVCRFAKMKLEKREDKLLIPTLEGTMRASKNDFIIRGLHSELYPIKPDLFEKTYEEVD